MAADARQFLDTAWSSSRGRRTSRSHCGLLLRDNFQVAEMAHSALPSCGAQRLLLSHAAVCGPTGQPDSSISFCFYEFFPESALAYR